MEDLQQTCKVPYLWEAKWVRPYESLWSIIRNFRIINGITSYTMFYKSLGISRNRNTKYKIDLDYAIYQTIPNYPEFIECVKNQLLPSDYIEHVKPVSRYLQHAPDSLSLKLRFCSKCIGQGYHSYFHQLSGLSTCIFHPDESLNTDYGSSYMIGQDIAFPFDKYDNKYMEKVRFSLFHRQKLCDFNEKANCVMPFEWEELPLGDTSHIHEIYTDFEEFIPISSSYVSVNRESNMGKLLFKNFFNMTSAVTIYDSKSCDEATIKVLEKNYVRRADDLRPMYTEELWIIEVSNIIKHLINGYTAEEIEYKGYQIYYGKDFDRYDFLAANLIFIWKYIGFSTIESSLEFGIYHNYSDIGRSKHRINSPICITDINWHGIIQTYGISAACHVIRLHFNYCYNMFLRYIQRKCNYGNGKFCIESDLDEFYVPTYFIEKKGGVISIY